MTDYTAAQLATAYFKQKKLLKEMAAEHDAQQKKIKENVALLEQELAEVMHNEKLEAVKVPGGTVGFRTRIVYKTDDLPAVRMFAMETENTELLTMSLSSSGVKAYVDARGELPPGVYPLELEELYNSPARSK